MSSRTTPMSAKTPARTLSTQKKPTGSASGGKQQSILGFFSKPASAAKATPTPTSTAKDTDAFPTRLKETTKTNFLARPSRSTVTPVPSSDAIDPPSSQENLDSTNSKTPRAQNFMNSSPTRKVRKVVNYAESDDEDEDPFERIKSSRSRRPGRARATVVDDDEDEFDAGDIVDEADDDDMDDFIASEDSDGPSRPRKRKRAESRPQPRKKSTNSPPTLKNEELPDLDLDMNDVVSSSGCLQWRFDSNNSEKAEAYPVRAPPSGSRSAGRERPGEKEPEQRYPWLANRMDINKVPEGHPDFDPSTVYVPPSAWAKFSAFEKQYWEIKQKLWDTVVFFKKGKFYELYENDATRGHQLFDLKMTDRVNMRMVGVPESSLGIWVNQFVAKGFKVARVDQMESALGKEMRERDGTAKAATKADKIIKRELTCVLTGGTLVDGSMLQDDMAVYCAAIKESTSDDGKPSFGIAFVDAATGRFSISEFEDDVDLTKFETFVAQISPRELVLEKSHVSTKALRILKNNTSPTTIWNYRKSEVEFWDATVTRRELESGEYFSGDQAWPETLQEAKDKDLLMSALGALIDYLRSLKAEKSLVSQGNFEWYSPIHRDGTLILDGQTLINLEVFANTLNGGSEGTLFNLLNRCVTPFGKRLFRQWVCHPLQNIKKINERLDAVDQLNADHTLRGQFTSQMTKMPDLERLLSRIHAGSIRPDDFVKVLNGFEQIEKTMGLLEAVRGGNGLIDRLVSGMPDLSKPLTYWNSAFNRKRALEEKILVPERGIESDFDESLDRIADIKKSLDDILRKKKNELKCPKLKFTDIGKEVYQIEAPKSVKVPSNWRQMSATSSVKRYYFGELSNLVRELQEAEETHSQIVKETASRFFLRFDEDYATWIQAVRIMAQLDCLAGLAKASSFIGQPSCRPEFIDEERTTLDFEELRHPCMLNTVSDFIPNDIKLGGDTPNISLLTGANAAGKSTILRMSCIAVIMAQIGCYVPAKRARLTPTDRIMSRLGANDNIFASQSTFFVELSETKKILAEATPRSLVILDELGRGTSSYDGVAVAQAVLHHVATHIGCVGFFATHYHSLASEFENHPEICARRMQIHVDEAERRVTFLYKLEDGVAEGSFGMHCAAMCGIQTKVIERAEVAAKEWEHTSRLKESLDKAKEGCFIPLGVLSDVGALLRGDEVGPAGMSVLLRAIEGL
ncbi:probable DNA mismatch repair protein [Cephalotrichum gorgonifer]|uniref:DNA mismatch repair protein n=1 Tax=Cephalotrichum gorgonifer TaxID=2041049 RepID=A0AAE8SV79_9PEZI|nr:probable DNA mismatch repair protein [Cephalotrichum gorgonifer]